MRKIKLIKADTGEVIKVIKVEACSDNKHIRGYNPPSEEEMLRANLKLVRNYKAVREGIFILKTE